MSVWQFLWGVSLVCSQGLWQQVFSFHLPSNVKSSCVHRILRAGQSCAQCLPNFWKHLLTVYSPISGACEFVLLQNPWCIDCVMKPQCHPLTSALYRVHDKSLITTMPLAGRRHAHSLLSHLHEHYLASHATYDAVVTACTRVLVVGQASLPSTFVCNLPAALTAAHGASVMLRVCCGRSREDQL